MYSLDSKKTVTENIKQLRLDNQWTKAEIAYKLNISLDEYSAIEMEHTDLFIKKLEDIASLFSVHVVQLINGDLESSHAEYAADNIKLMAKIQQREDEIILLQRKVIKLQGGPDDEDEY